MQNCFFQLKNYCPCSRSCSPRARKTNFCILGNVGNQQNVKTDKRGEVTSSSSQNTSWKTLSKHQHADVFQQQISSFSTACKKKDI